MTTTTTLVATVTVAPAAGFATVQLQDGVTARVASARDIGTVVVGDQVLVTVNGGQMWITSVLGTVAPPPPPPPTEPETKPVPPPEQRDTITGNDTPSPIWSGTWRNGWRSDTGSDLYSGDWTGRGINRAVSMFGSLDALGTLTAGTATLRRLQGGVFGAQAPTMTLTAPGSKSASFPTILASVAGPSIAVGGSAEWTVPTGWLTQLQDGIAGGIGIGTGVGASPYIHLAPINLEVSWERNR